VIKLIGDTTERERKSVPMPTRARLAINKKNVAKKIRTVGAVSTSIGVKLTTSQPLIGERLYETKTDCPPIAWTNAPLASGKRTIKGFADD
jgi:hypothetical protein